MPIARYIAQFAVVGTATHGGVLKRIKQWTGDDKAETVRTALDSYFELDDGELPDGVTIDDVALAAIRRTRPDFMPPAEADVA